MATELLNSNKDLASDYERQLDRNYSLIGESCSDMVERKVSALLRFLSQQTPLRRHKVLDVGCGVGLAEKILSDSPLIESVTGIDLSFESLHVASDRALPSAHYVQANGIQLPFNSGIFDAVFTVCTLHHVDTSLRLEFLREMYRVLRPQGWLFAFEHNPYNPITRFFVRICEWDHGCKLLRPSELVSNFMNTNLRDIRRHFLVFFPSLLKPALAFEKHLWWCPLGAQFFVSGKK